MKYCKWLEEWLELYVKPTVKIQTYKRYALIARNQIYGGLGHYEIDELTPIVLQRFIVGLSAEKQFAGNTVNSVITVVQKSLRTAEEVGVIKKQFSDKIRRPKITEKSVEGFSEKEQKAIEKFVFENPKKSKLFGIILCLYSGLRIGELLALKWEDIDFSSGIMTISRSCHDEYKDGKLLKVYDTPKTKNSARTIPIPRQIIPHLKKIKRRSDSEYVISGKNDIGVRSYQKTFECILKKLHIPHKGFHALRHTFATRAIECGMDVKTLSEILGHKNPEITLKRYAHSMLEHKAEMMNIVGRKLLR